MSPLLLMECIILTCVVMKRIIVGVAFLYATPMMMILLNMNWEHPVLSLLLLTVSSTLIYMYYYYYYYYHLKCTCIQ